MVKISNIWRFWRARRILPDNQNSYTSPSLPPSGNNNIGEFTHHIKTILHKTDKSFAFLLGDYNHDGYLDLYAIKKRNTNTKSTEVHILSGKNNFQSFLLQTGTKLNETRDNMEFCLGDYNHDGYLDLYAIKKRNTNTKSTEVHILSGKNNFQSFLLHTGTKLNETRDNMEFCLGDYNSDGYLDLYSIYKNETGSKSTEVHILSGKNNFQSFLLQTGTILHETGDNFTFGISNYAGQGNKDLYAIKKNQTDTKSTEVHILSGKNNFQSFLLHTGTKLHETGDNFEFITSGHNLYAIKKDGDNNLTEILCLKI